MIRVTPQDEPADFNEKVRIPGRLALQELTGVKIKRRGRPRSKDKIAGRLEDIKAEHLTPYWQKCMDDLLRLYNRVCAYTSLYIPYEIGAPSVDHYWPKSGVVGLRVGPDEDPHAVYEWGNYRLACLSINQQKDNLALIVDPFDVEDHWFELELTDYQIRTQSGLDAELDAHLWDNIQNRLKLNTTELCTARREAAEEHLLHGLSIEALARKSPFVARELLRQGKARIEGGQEVQRG